MIKFKNNLQLLVNGVPTGFSKNQTIGEDVLNEDLIKKLVAKGHAVLIKDDVEEIINDALDEARAEEAPEVKKKAKKKVAKKKATKKKLKDFKK